MNRKLYRKVAREHGVSIREVKREIQFAIDEAYKNPTDSTRIARFNGRKPTADELVSYLVQEVTNAKITN
jgi:hypothetical protein